MIQILEMCKKAKTWLDCDPGLDDAFAIVLTAFSNAIDLIGISSLWQSDYRQDYL